MVNNIFFNLSILMFAHWVGDFVLQTNSMAINKSKSNWALIKHTIVYSLVMGLATQILIEFNLFGAQYWWAAIMFGLVQFISHTVIDYITSRVSTYYWVNEKRYEFFTNIGLDQYMHFLVLITSLYYFFY